MGALARRAILPGAKDSISLSGAASRYPKLDGPRAQVVGLEEQVNTCRQRRMASDPLPLGSRTMNLLLGYIKYLGRGHAINVSKETDAAADAIKRGRASFYRKTGQLNFSCADCHSASGNWLRGQRVPKLDQTAATWPKHYIAAHDLGLINLRQRIMHCQIVTSTYPMPLHSEEYLDLEYYLTSLANGSPLLAPTMSRLRGE
jgi:sulfur-oxidizing protein SoxA